MLSPWSSLSDVVSADVDSVLNAVGVIRAVQPCVSLVSKAGKPYKKREVVLIDSSSTSVSLTLWNALGELADEEFEIGAVLTVTAAKVGEFRGRNLSTTAKSVVHVWRQGPVRNRGGGGSSGGVNGGSGADDEVRALQAWVQGRGGNVTSLPLTGSASKGSNAKPSAPRQTLHAIAEQDLGRGGVQAYCSVKATVTTIRSERAWYPACVTCSKKTMEDASGRFACLTCKVRVDRPQNRYMLSVLLTDAHTSQLATLFDDAARALLPVSADEAEEMQQASQAQFKKLFRTPLFRMFTFELTVKQEERVEEVVDKRGKRSTVNKVYTRVNASRACKPEFDKESGRLLKCISEYE